MKEICTNCYWFRPEPIMINPSSPAAIDQAIKTVGQRADLNGGSVPPTYGKCRAVFQNSQNETQEYDLGKFSSSACSVRDDLGYKLFKVG